MRLILHLRRVLAPPALGSRPSAKVLKGGLVKAAGAATVGLVIPVSALATYALPVSAIEHFAAPLVGTAPDIFDIRALARRRIRAAFPVGKVRRALGRMDAIFDSDPNSDQ